MCQCFSVKEVKAAFVCNQVKIGSNRREIHTYVEKIWKMPVFPTWLRLHFCMVCQSRSLKSSQDVKWDKVVFFSILPLITMTYGRKELFPLSPEARWDTPLEVMPILSIAAQVPKLIFYFSFPTFVNRSFFFYWSNFPFPLKFYFSFLFTKQNNQQILIQLFKPTNFKGYIKIEFIQLKM